MTGTSGFSPPFTSGGQGGSGQNVIADGIAIWKM
jgi:hypothetical protein